MQSALIVLFACVAYASAFGNTEDKFIKKYAMMKIYESCFGSEVVKQIRKEMKAACSKCAALEAPPMLAPASSRPLHHSLPHSLPPALGGSSSPLPNGDTKHAAAVAAAAAAAGFMNDAEAQQPNTLYSSPTAHAQFDAEKLQQAILSYRPNPYTGNIGYRPYNPAFYQGAGGFQQQPYPNFYNYQPQSTPYSPYGFPLFAPQFMGGNNRISRDMDIRSQLEALTSRLSGRVRNVTCVMQELGYLDANLEPNFQGIAEKIATLPISDELRKDMQDGVAFCQQFSQCVPDIKRDKSPLSRELVRPMFFFKCYKHKKLEACIMKDVREKYAGVADDDFEGEVEFRRTGKSAKGDEGATGAENIDDLATSMFDFLYGSDGSEDLDSLF